MPKKKTGARKKAEKQKARQKEIQSNTRELMDWPCNSVMVRFIFATELGGCINSTF